MSLVVVLFGGLLCLAVTIAIGAGVAIGLRAGKVAQAEEAAVDALLAEAGLDARPGSPWRAGELGGRGVVLRAKRVGRQVAGSGGPGSVSLGVGVRLLVPLDAEVPQHVFRSRSPAAGPPSGPADLTGRYHQLGNAPLDTLPEPLREHLLAWTVGPLLGLAEVGPRASRHLYADDQLPDARSLVSVERSGSPADAAEVRAWVEAWVARVAALEAALAGS